MKLFKIVVLSLALAPLVAVPRTSQAIRQSAQASLLTKEDVLSYLSTRLGDRPFQNPNQEAIKKELVELVKRRGVDFHYQPLSEFSKQLSKVGTSSEMKFALADNYGPPTKQVFLMDTWSMDVIGGRVGVVINNRAFQQGESAAKGGELTIRLNGTYVWQLYQNDPPEKQVKGAWRKATPKEMQYQGGEGIVLTVAKGGWDWIVFQDRTVPSGEKIRVAELTSRKLREFGSRVGRR
ncbi:hypothetical protein [Armatimonas sp.]|uniref:hypothetical protein n=1 Tax=Armatimonas sp. TaxID=1872638 RepID=UPI00286C7E49|nr:hypothetical protein [Armatimonas sp.]